MMLLPPKPGTCAACAVDHPADAPHNAQSLYYQYRFYGLRGRWPTWADAIAHCAENVRAVWKRELERANAWTEPPAGTEVIADPPAESIPQTVGDPNSASFGPEGGAS